MGILKIERIQYVTNQVMSPPSYYLVNHTRKEFCFYEDELPIFLALEMVLQKHTNWKNTDNVRIKSENSCSCTVLEYLTNDMEYKNVDYD
jgi:hypothetical protein